MPSNGNLYHFALPSLQHSMSAVALDYLYRYRQPSSLAWTQNRPHLRLATSGGVEENPHLFHGRLRAPREAADLLLALSRVVGSRFHIPPAMLARMLREADPVVTCSEERVRFEGFSACCGVYARVDFLEPAFEGEFYRYGTTNVDFQPAMRTALTRLSEGSEARLSVGPDDVELAEGPTTVVERKVPLPLRWLRGFLEVQAYQSRMEPLLSVDGVEAHRFLRGLPRQGFQGRPAWVVPSGRGLRLSQVATRGGVRVGGMERLRVLEELTRHALRLRAFQEPGGEASAWELTTPTARLHLVLSPEVWRGFSGEGQALEHLAKPAPQRSDARLRSALRWQARLDPSTLAADTGLPADQICGAFSRLAASGLVGFDLTESAYFHRELPYDVSLIEGLQPRLEAARVLVEARAVRIDGPGADGSEAGIAAWVRSGEIEHRVRLLPDGARCSCTWYGKHRDTRGPCKHVLAAQLTVDASPEPLQASTVENPHR